jgi:hypothetical protein
MWAAQAHRVISLTQRAPRNTGCVLSEAVRVAAGVEHRPSAVGYLLILTTSTWRPPPGKQVIVDDVHGRFAAPSFFATDLWM